MKYLITGGAGFIGSRLVEKLIVRGDQVVVLDNLSTGSASNLSGIKEKIKFEQGNILDRVKIDKNLEEKLKETFPDSEITVSTSGLCNIFIAKENKQEMIKSFKLIKKNRDEFSQILNDEICEFIKEISISQSNLENIFIEVKYLLKLVV